MTKIISTVFIGLLLPGVLWVACYFLLAKMYPKYSLQIRHHIFSLIVAVATFALYCFFSTVSATISGIEYALDSARNTVIEKSDIVDNITATLLSGAGRQIAVNETNNFISSALSTNAELNSYIKDLDFSEIDTENIVNILSTNEISVKEKSLQIIDNLFDSYVGKYTKTLKRMRWGFLITMIVVQLIYWVTMIYDVKNGSRRSYNNESRLTTSKETKRDYRKSSDHRVRRHRR